LGKLLYSKNLTLKTAKELFVIDPVEELTVGVYTVTVSSAKDFFTKKIIVF
jgi:hypothetical protein